MAFGSFWKGIHLVELNSKTGLRISSNSPIHHLAYHDSIEAASIVRGTNNYYLFVNWGICCRGTNSTYEVRVGRSETITGPYRDAQGVDLAAGGGTMFMQSQGTDIGPGHVSLLQANGREWVTYNVYDAKQNGRARIRMRELRWTAEGWPEAGALKN